MALDQRVGKSDFDERLPGHAETTGLLIDLAKQVHREADVHALNGAARPNGLGEVHARRQVDAASCIASSSAPESALALGVRCTLQERFTAGLATFAAAFTVLLACMGLYGLLAYSVTARTREIGVRVALGATRWSLVAMFVREGVAIAIAGVAVGALCAWAAARLVRAQLYGVAPGDPRTQSNPAAILLAMVLASSLLPALRASRIVPLDALREE
jgi:hypothetical protein